MNREFCTYEIAKALKDMGFDEECLMWYPHEKLLTADLIFRQYKDTDEFCNAPLWQQARRWIAIVHDLDITIEPYWNTEYQEKNYKVYNTVEKETFSNFYTYDEALENGIKRAINLIKKKLAKLNKNESRH